MQQATDQRAEERAATETEEPTEEGAFDFSALLNGEPDTTFALERAPVIDRIHRHQLTLLRAKAPTLTWEELGQAMEIAWSYQLDPFAGEIWFAKSKTGKLLIMVGRDGLRKIVQRNGLDMDCDVVRKNDVFTVTRGTDRVRLIVHEYKGGIEERGPIIGSWAETWDPETGKQRGYFFAPYKEYKPTSMKVLEHSPWGSQESVMMLAAAERQAARQATPLGGLLTEGEMDLNDERALDGGPVGADGIALEAIVDGLEAPEGLRDELLGAMVEMNALVPAAWSAGKAQMAFTGRTEEQLRADVEQIRQDAEAMRVRMARKAPAEPEKAEPEEPVADATVVTDGERRTELEAQVSELEEVLSGDDASLPDNRETLNGRLDALNEELANLPED